MHPIADVVKRAVRTAMLGDDIRSTLRIVFLIVLLDAFHVRSLGGARVRAALSRPAQLRLTSGINVSARWSDVPMLMEVIGDDIYAEHLTQLPGEIRTVVDLGANIGLASIEIHRRHPRARFVCVEPSPATARVLERNIRSNGINAAVEQVAIGATEGHAFFDHDVLPAAAHLSDEETGEPVKLMTLAGLLDQQGITSVELLKVDIEGAERQLLETVADWAPRVRTIIGEVHAPMTGADALDTLAEHGFRRLGAEKAPIDGVETFAATRG